MERYLDHRQPQLLGRGHVAREESLESGPTIPVAPKMMTFMVCPSTDQGLSGGHHLTRGEALAGKPFTHAPTDSRLDRLELVGLTGGLRYHGQPMTDSGPSMKPPEDDDLLRDMLTFSRRAVNAVAEKDRSDLDSDVVLAAALERFIDVVGEAASKVSVSTREGTPDIPWPKIIFFCPFRDNP